MRIFTGILFIILIIVVMGAGMFFYSPYKILEKVDISIPWLKNFSVENISTEEEKKDSEGIGEKLIKEEEQRKQERQEFPRLSNPENKKFGWEYEGKEYNLDFTFYKSVYNYYSNLSKKYICRGGECKDNWKTEYFKMFIKGAKKDDSMERLLGKFKKMAPDKLSSDQLLEFAISFVQYIPYNQKKAEKVNSLPNYPYQVLFKQSGVCSGKSFLAARLAKEMGYGVALFEYPMEDHMTVAIKCKQKYSSYGSGYCQAEVTYPGWSIGIIDFKEIDAIKTPNVPAFRNKPKIYPLYEGKTYNRVSFTIKKFNRLNALENQRNNLEKQMRNYKKELDLLESKMNKLSKKEEREKYNNLVNKYNSTLSLYKQKIEDYNEKTSQYNQLTEEFSPSDFSSF